MENLEKVLNEIIKMQDDKQKENIKDLFISYNDYLNVLKEYEHAKDKNNNLFREQLLDLNKNKKLIRKLDKRIKISNISIIASIFLLFILNIAGTVPLICMFLAATLLSLGAFQYVNYYKKSVITEETKKMTKKSDLYLDNIDDYNKHIENTKKELIDILNSFKEILNNIEGVNKKEVSSIVYKMNDLQYTNYKPLTRVKTNTVKDYLQRKE